MATIKFESRLIQIGTSGKSVYLRIPNAMAFNILSLNPGQGAVLSVNPDKPHEMSVSFPVPKKTQKKT